MGNSMRLNKFFTEAGFCSRREADRLIEDGKITVNGSIAIIGMQVEASDEIRCNGKIVRGGDEDVLLVFNKPRGIVCTGEKREKNNIIDYLNYPLRIFTIGRLDKDSQGLILMTNQGDLVNKILRAGNFHEKEYVVRVDKKITKKFLSAMGAGVPILDTITRKCKITKIDNYTFNIILTQGLNRQIRRMCSHLGYEVRELKRIRVMNFELGELAIGEYREATKAELKKLNVALKHSSSLPCDNHDLKK